MNKREVVWLIIRLIGVYFSYAALVAAFSLLGVIWMLISVSSKAGENDLPARVEQPAGIPGIRPDSIAKPPSHLEQVGDEAKREVFKQLLWQLFLTVLQGGLGFYLLAYGGIFFNILMRENEGQKKEREPESILLNLTE